MMHPELKTIGGPQVPGWHERFESLVGERVTLRNGEPITLERVVAGNHDVNGWKPWYLEFDRVIPPGQETPGGVVDVVDAMEESLLRRDRMRDATTRR